MLRVFGFSILLTITAIILAFAEKGMAAAFTITVLIAIEVAFSFDNAVINAKVLVKLSKFWQQLFLTVGLLIAVVGMRFIFPIVIVMITAGQSWATVIDDALNHPEVYAEHLEEAHVAIGAFGGAFLLTLTLFFFLDSAREILWLKRIEKYLQKFGHSVLIPPIVATVIIVAIAAFAGSDSKEVLQAGLLGVALYTGMKLTIDWLGRMAPKGQKILKGWPALFGFLYLEVLDASFSFDGVLGAFAITDDVLLIALGLGVGAIWVRSLTVYFVRHGTLSTYKYLEHGAHYAIFVLSIALLSSLYIEVPDAITGFVGIGIIVASFISSREAKHSKQKLSG